VRLERRAEGIRLGTDQARQAVEDAGSELVGVVNAEGERLVGGRARELQVAQGELETYVGCRSGDGDTEGGAAQRRVARLRRRVAQRRIERERDVTAGTTQQHPIGCRSATTQ